MREEKNKVHPRAMHEGVNEWMYTTDVEAGEEWSGTAGTVRHYALQWTGIREGVKRV
jgi:hypothetical protein